MSNDLGRAAERLRKLALTYPETYEETPWGDRVTKVRGKIFLFCGARDGELHVSVKLPQSRREVLTEPFAKPTPYGLGKSGWVSSTFGPGRAIPESRIAAWIEESYRALAPKKLVALLDAPAPDDPPGRSGPANKTGKASKADGAARAAGARGKTRPARRLKQRVLILSQDRLRSERAAAALDERGVTLQATASAADVRARLKKIDALIVDVGRQQEEGIALAAEIDASDLPILLFIVGIRDASARKRAQSAATSADLFRAPPGDPAVADAIAATLTRYAK